MAKIFYKEFNFRPASLRIIQTANAIIREYQLEGYELTLRQLYYQFVAKNLIPNTPQSYKNLGALINDGRLAGLVDWDAIVDRTRNLKGVRHYDGPSELIRESIDRFAIDKWKDQEFYIEIWVEKEALAGVVERIAVQNDVNFFCCRGYTSQSEMHAAAMRMKYYREREDKTPIIIHLGDHDPSGIDMSRDVADRFELFIGGCEVRRIALNMDQVEEHSPPPNPAKITDSRAQGYIKKFGKESWELDALRPQLIHELIQAEIDTYRDQALWEKACKLEREQRKELEKAARAMEE